jgi:hypothetical protein
VFELEVCGRIEKCAELRCVKVTMLCVKLRQVLTFQYIFLIRWPLQGITHFTAYLCLSSCNLDGKYRIVGLLITLSITSQMHY